MTNDELRTHLINILDDENGISDAAFDSVRDMARCIAAVAPARYEINDILALVDSADGRFFLPENHGLQ